MLHAVLRILDRKNLLKFLGGIVLVLLSGCAFHGGQREGKTKIAPQKVFTYPMDRVWRAAQLSLNYPIKVENLDQGYIQTEEVRSSEGFQSPVAEDARPSVRYSITLNLTKGNMGGRPSTLVTIGKKISASKDFFSEDSEYESDGLEELSIFYRIERELIVQDGLARAQKSSP
jgi:hypothetical protein